jgi:hypothetical protein
VLLMDMERLDELQQHLEKCIRIRTIDKSWVYGRFALLEELRRPGGYKKTSTPLQSALFTPN